MQAFHRRATAKLRLRVAAAETQPDLAANRTHVALPDHGAGDDQFGVSFADLDRLKKRIKTDQALATREVRLLAHSMHARFKLPAGCAWVNYVRVHDDIGWTFSDEDAATLGVNGYDHRQFLNQFFTGRFPGSFARGLLLPEHRQRLFHPVHHVPIFPPHRSFRSHSSRPTICSDGAKEFDVGKVFRIVNPTEYASA